MGGRGRENAGNGTFMKGFSQIPCQNMFKSSRFSLLWFTDRQMPEARVVIKTDLQMPGKDHPPPPSLLALFKFQQVLVGTGPAVFDLQYIDFGRCMKLCTAQGNISY